MRSYVDAVAFAEHQRLAPTQSWHFLCQSFSRQCVGAAAWAPSAKAAYEAIPSVHRHAGTPRAGSLVYFSGDPGHVVFMVSGGYCYSNDILRDGKIDKVPLSLIHTKWNLTQRGWIDWTPSGAINLAPTAPTVHLSHLQAAAKLDPPAAQGHTTYPAEVAVVERALARLGFLPAAYVDGSYGTKTVAAYASFQSSIRAAVHTGIPQLADLRVLGSKGGFLVVA